MAPCSTNSSHGQSLTGTDLELVKPREVAAQILAVGRWCLTPFTALLSGSYGREDGVLRTSMRAAFGGDVTSRAVRCVHLQLFSHSCCSEISRIAPFARLQVLQHGFSSRVWRPIRWESSLVDPTGSTAEGRMVGAPSGVAAGPRSGFLKRVIKSQRLHCVH